MEVDELRAQLETACKNNEKVRRAVCKILNDCCSSVQAIFERMESISHLNQQLHECQRQYTELLTSKSMETFNQTENKRQLTRLTEEKEKLELTCQEFQVYTDRNDYWKNHFVANLACSKILT